MKLCFFCCEKQVQMDASFTLFYWEHHNIYSYNPLFVQINCPDISESKFQFPDKNNLFACLYIWGKFINSKILSLNPFYQLLILNLVLYFLMSVNHIWSLARHINKIVLIGNCQMIIDSGKSIAEGVKRLMEK